MNGTRGLLIATAAAFVVGCSVGLMGGILFMRWAVPGPHARFERGMRGGPPPFMIRRGPGPGHEERTLSLLERELNLTPEQHVRLIRVLDRARKEREALHDSLKIWLARELTPEQQARWKEVEEHRIRSMRERRGRGPQ